MIAPLATPCTCGHTRNWHGATQVCLVRECGCWSFNAASDAPAPEPAAPRVFAEARPDWDSYYLAGAQWAASRADCTRAQVGALVVSREHRIGVGYNGLIAGVPGCASAGNCPRGRHYATHGMLEVSPGGWTTSVCACGDAWPCASASEPDSDYANCPATHAERNAIQHSRPEDLPGATLYVTRAPCPACTTLIRAAGIARVVTPEGSYEV